MVLIVMVSAGMDSFANFSLTRPAQLSLALSSVAGTYAPYMFGIGLVAATFLALVVISLAGAWGIAEAIGWGRNRYFWLYLAESVPAVFVPLIFSDLISLALSLMVALGFVLIGPAVIMGLVASNKKIMGSYAFSRIWNFAYWFCLATIVLFGVLAVVIYV